MHQFVMNAQKSLKPSNHHEFGDRVDKTFTSLAMPSSYQEQNNNDKVTVENLAPDLAHQDRTVHMSLGAVLNPVSSNAAVADARFRAGTDYVSTHSNIITSSVKLDTTNQQMVFFSAQLSDEVDEAIIHPTGGNDENVVQMLEHHFGVTIPITQQGNLCKRCIRILNGIYDKSEGKKQEPKFCCESHAGLSKSVE